ncbi:hypothetical protein C1645_773883 [Glomus cerebriforme]|uniref:Uncharacterized protein n=1 Tax=Glomus cerebriforme TaxID=658196 RepID=A0A397SRK7_9GLOM|nr:hypothetical protein C1645_773883 [Glomus cerebriforme]
MRKYKLRQEPYNEVIRNLDETSILCNYLQELALYVLSVILHSTSCKGVFLILRCSKYSKDELKVMVDKFLDNLEENFKDSEPERILIEPNQIPNHIVLVLILEKIFDVDKVPFIRNLEDSNDEENDDNIDDNDDNNNNNIPKEELVENYDVLELASRFLD